MLPIFNLRGDLVRIRPVEIADAGPVLDALEPEATQNLQFFSTPVDLGRQVEYLEQMRSSRTDLLASVVLQYNGGNDGRIVGTVGLHEIDTHLKLARFGLLIFRTTDRGQGFGNDATQLMLYYAFEVLGLNKVNVNIFEENVRGQKHYQRLGFTFEGRLREEYLLNGTYYDLMRLTMLKREWSHQPKE